MPTTRFQGIVIVKSDDQNFDQSEKDQLIEDTLDNLLGYGHYRPSSFAASGVKAFEISVDAGDDETDEQTLINELASASGDNSILFVEMSNPFRPRAVCSTDVVDREPLAQAADRLTSFVTSNFMNLATDIQRG